jgi:hypothetical protein
MEDGIQSPAHVKQFCVFYPCFEPQQQVSRAPLDEMTGRTTEHIVAHAAGFGVGLTHRNSAVAARWAAGRVQGTLASSARLRMLNNFAAVHDQLASFNAAHAGM